MVLNMKERDSVTKEIAKGLKNIAKLKLAYIGSFPKMTLSC